MRNYKWMTFGTDEKGNFRVCSRCNKKVYIITNADKIRAKSDEELAKWLTDWDFCTDVCSQQYTDSPFKDKWPGNCEEQALKWLQQPAEEEKL